MGGGPSAKYLGVINQLWGGPSAKYGGSSTNYGGPSAKYGGVINQLWGDHQPNMGGAISQVWGGIFPPVCTGSQNPENYFSNTYVLPSVNRTAGPIKRERVSHNTQSWQFRTTFKENKFEVVTEGINFTAKFAFVMML